MIDLHTRIAALTPEQRAVLEARLAELAAARGPHQPDRIRPRDRSLPTPLSVAQQREWAVGRIRAGNNITGALRLAGRLDLPLLSGVLTEIVDRHEVLRTIVEAGEDGAPVQVVRPVTPVPTPVVDLTHLPSARRDDELTRRARTDAARPFDPADPQRLRVTLLRLAPDEHVALFAADHAASDAWSLAILVEELAAIFRSRVAGGGPALPPLEVQFGDYAVWQREQLDADRAELEVQHWRDELAGMPTEQALPVDRPYPARPTYACGVYDMHLPAGLTAEVHRFGEREGASLFTVLLAACSVLLHRYVGEDEVVVGSLVSGRTRSETQALIGSFANPLPLRVRLRPDLTLREVVSQAHRTLASALDHQDLPFDRVVEELGLGRESARTSFSPVWLNVLTVPDTTLELPGLRITPVSFAPATTSVDLTLNVTPRGDRLLTQWHYMTELFDAATVTLLAEQFQRVLYRLVTEPDTPVWEVELATGAGTDEPVDGPIVGFVEQFRRRVAVAPHAPAVICDGVAVSYLELERRANRLAHRLRAAGVGPDSRVGVLVDRSPALAVAILGVLEAGGAYVPIDPGYPAERITFLLTDSHVRVLITEPGLAQAPGTAGPWTTVLVDDGDSGDDPAVPLSPPDLASAAYVVYTSGSTGRPKGAVIEHRSLAVFARDVVDRLGLGTGDRFLQFASPSFDVLAEELFPTWLAGGVVVIPTRHLLSGGDDLVSLVERERLTVMELPTAYWHEWVRELDRTGRTLPEHLRLVIIGGERVLPERLAMWRRTGVPLAHVYGLTETTVSSTFFRLDPGDPVTELPNLPIGTPLPSADLRILDRRLRPVPDGGVGELYIGGVSLARGYLGRPGLTAQRFVADPARPGERLYRTGDLVRRRVDGNLEFRSRVDRQIKIRGFRVEPTEIESVLTDHPGVAAAVVTAYEPAPGDRRLVAYTVPAAAPAIAPVVGELRAFLAERLPAHLVPSAFVELAALPLNANGKIDRDRLPAPDRADPPLGADSRGPESATERKLAEIVAGVVGVPHVGVEENFFEMGGDSILAIQVVAQAQEAGLRLTPYDLFASPSVAELAAVAVAGQTIDAEQADVTGPVPLAPTQHWFCAAGFAEPAHWNTSMLLDLSVDVDPGLLREAVEHVVGHHDGLRQRLLLAGARTRSRIAPRGDETPFAVRDLSDGDPEIRVAEVCAELQRGLDPAVGPMLRVALLRTGHGRPDRLAVVAHRLVADAPSMRILLEDLETAMVQLAAGEELRFLPKTTSWQSWGRRLAAYAASESVQGQRAYWSEVVAPGGQSVSALPTDHTVEAGTDTQAGARTVTETLDAAATRTLHTAAQRLACTVDELLLAALARTLGEWTGVARHLVDVERHDRPRLFDDVDLTRTVGWFSRIHPLVLAADGSQTLRSIRESLRAVPAGGTGWQLLHQGRDPLPDVPVDLLFSYTGATAEPASGAFTVAADTVGADRSPAGRRPYPIEVRAAVLHGELVTTWEYSEPRHTGATMARLAARYTAELRSLIGAGDTARTAADYPLARVDRAQLDGLLGRLAGDR